MSDFYAYVDEDGRVIVEKAGDGYAEMKREGLEHLVGGRKLDDLPEPLRVFWTKQELLDYYSRDDADDE